MFMVERRSWAWPVLSVMVFDLKSGGTREEEE